jgi:hypothetical protein
MKVRLTFKTPDVLDDALDEIGDAYDQLPIRNLCKRWIQYEEYITVEIDTEAKTCEVVPL